MVRTYLLPLTGGASRLSDAYGSGVGVVDPAADIPFRHLVLTPAPGPVTIGDATVSLTRGVVVGGGGGGGGAPARVQATPQATATGTTTVAVTFAAPPTIGNAVVVAVIANTTPNETGVTDNRGNSYSLVRGQSEANGTMLANVWLCPAIITTGAPFTVTSTGVSRSRMAIALEVGGVGGGLAVDQSAAGTILGNPFPVGPTPALTVAQALLVAVAAVSGGTFITVDAPSPPWTQEAEVLNATPVTGEVDSRVVTSAVGTTPSVTWTLDGGRAGAGLLIAFKAGAAGGGGSGSQLALGPFETGPLKLSQLYAFGSGALQILGVPY